VCHGGSLFTDNQFHNIGVRPDTEDTGREQVTGLPTNRSEFRTPSLRNVELRGSYFHNGRFKTLEEVVAFYNRGGDFAADNKPNLIHPLNLTPQQQADLVAFLKRPLTDPRVSAESGPFSRPTLYMESDRVPLLFGAGRAGSGGFVPQMNAVSPPLIGNPNFTMSVTSALGNANATLVVDTTDPGLTTTIPPTGALARIVTTTQQTGAGNGWASVSFAIPDNAVAGRTYFARWYVADPSAANGIAISQPVTFKLFSGSGALPTAAPVNVSGRVTTWDGAGIRGVAVTLVDDKGNRRSVTTGAFGSYLFSGVMSGQAIVVSIASKQYRFNPSAVSINLTNELTGVDFTALQSATSPPIIGQPSGVRSLAPLSAQTIDKAGPVGKR
jgi:hypothetical protein